MNADELLEVRDYVVETYPLDLFLVFLVGRMHGEITSLKVMLKDAGDLLADEDANDQIRLEVAGHIRAALRERGE